MTATNARPRKGHTKPLTEAEPVVDFDPAEPIAAPVSGAAAPNGLSPEEIEKLVTDNVALAYHVANTWMSSAGRNRMSQEDVVSQAIAGLVKAANTWKPGGAPFGAYARRVIQNWVHHQDWHQDRYAKSQRDVLDAPAGEDEDSTMHDRVSGGDEAGDTSAERISAKDLVRSAIADLPSPEREMLTDWISGQSYRDLEPKYGVSAMQIGNRVRAGLARLKSALASKGVTDINDIWPTEESTLRCCSNSFLLECLVSAAVMHVAKK